VHSFRIFTVALAWVLTVAAFYQWPEMLTGAQRLIQHGLEAVGDAIPLPCGARLELVFREICGLIWLQITLLVLALRIALSTIAAIWRFFRDRESRAFRDEWSAGELSAPTSLTAASANGNQHTAALLASGVPGAGHDE
jgi:hypothetical protein